MYFEGKRELWSAGISRGDIAVAFAFGGDLVDPVRN
jgi:hypothetical protein